MAVAALWTCVFAHDVARATDEPTAESAFFADIPVVISATRLAQRVDDTPTFVTVIDRETIDAAGIVEFADILRLVPGFQVAHTSGNLFTVTAHGTGAPWFSRVQVLVDGQSLYQTSFSGLDWVHLGISLVDVERVEVVRGANIPTYGANAIMGTVNIITRQPFQDRGFFLQGTYGSRDRRDGVIRKAGDLGGMDYRVTLEHRENAGFSDVDDDTRLSFASFRGLLNLTPRDELDVHLSYGESRLGLDLQPIFSEDARRVRADYQFVRWNHAQDSGDSFYLQLTRDHSGSKQDTRILASDLVGVAPRSIPLLFGQSDQEVSVNDFDGTSDRYEVEFQQFLRPHPRTRLVWGAGYRWERFRDDLLGSNETKNGNSTRLSGNLEWRPSDTLVANLGAMLESNSVTDGTAFSPRLGVNYAITNRHTVRASITRAHRFPSLLEENRRDPVRFDDGSPIGIRSLSDGGLATEIRDQAEIGYLGRFPDPGLAVEARLYHEDVRAAAVFAIDVGCPDQPIAPSNCFRVGDYMDYRVTGLETLMTLRPRPRDMVRLGYAYADARGRAPLTFNPTTYQDLGITVPRHSASLLLSHGFGNGWEGSAVWYYMDDHFWHLNTTSPVDAYHRVDLRLAKSFKVESAAGKIELIVQNLANEYQEFSTRNRFEPRAFLRASFQLK